MSSKTRFTRRDLIKAGAVGGAPALLREKAPAQTAARLDQKPIPIDEIAFTGCGVGGEPMATSPFITQPFTQELAIPEALRPGWRYENGTLANPNDPNAWTVRKSAFGAGVVRPGPETGHQDALGDRPAL